HRGRASVLRISSELEEATPIARCAGSDLTILSISHFVPATIRVTVLRSATIADKRKNCIGSLFSPRGRCSGRKRVICSRRAAGYIADRAHRRLALATGLGSRAV